MPVQTSFAKKVTKTENADDCFLTTLRNDGELDLTLQDVKDRVRSCTLSKNNLILLIFRYGFSIAHFGEKGLSIKRNRASPSRNGSVFSYSPVLSRNQVALRPR